MISSFYCTFKYSQASIVSSVGRFLPGIRSFLRCCTHVEAYSASIYILLAGEVLASGRLQCVSFSIRWICTYSIWERLMWGKGHHSYAIKRARTKLPVITTYRDIAPSVTVAVLLMLLWLTV
jgi:hypothetical protein